MYHCGSGTVGNDRIFSTFITGLNCPNYCSNCQSSSAKHNDLWAAAKQADICSKFAHLFFNGVTPKVDSLTNFLGATQHEDENQQRFTHTNNFTLLSPLFSPCNSLPTRRHLQWRPHRVEASFEIGNHSETGIRGVRLWAWPRTTFVLGPDRSQDSCD